MMSIKKKKIETTHFKFKIIKKISFSKGSILKTILDNSTIVIINEVKLLFEI